MQLTKDFELIEFVCKDGTAVPDSFMQNVKELAENLQVLRDELGEPIRINSGYRSPSYNRRIGGKPASKHLLAQAADITVKGRTPRQLAAIIERLIRTGKMKQGGIGLYPGFVHYDVRGTRARW